MEEVHRSETGANCGLRSHRAGSRRVIAKDRTGHSTGRHVPHSELERRVALVRADTQVGACLDEELRTVGVVAVVARPVKGVVIIVAIGMVGVGPALEEQAHCVRLVTPHGISKRCGAVGAVAGGWVLVEVLPLVKQFAKSLDVPLVGSGPE